MIPTMHLFLLFWACTSEQTPETKDDSVAQDFPTPVCTEATSIQKVREYLDVDLPNSVSHDHTMQGIAVGDLDGDGWLDVLMAYGGGSAGFRNDGTGDLILDPSIDMDGGPLASGQAATLADLDGDGDLDAYLGRDKGDLGLILTNDGTGHFTSVTLPDSGQSTSTGAFADFDNDGDLDLYTAATVTNTDAYGVLDGSITRGDGDRLFIRGSDGLYTNETTQRVPSDSDWGWTFQGSPLDYDNDGDLDIYLAHDMGAYILPNRLLRNDGTGHFTRDADCFCELTMYGMGAAVGDANNDGLPDLYITDIGGPNLLANAGDGTFIDATLGLGADVPPTEENLTSWGATFVDINLDSWPDIAMVFGQLGQPELTSALAGVGPALIDGPNQSDVLLLSDATGQYHRAVDAWPEGFSERAIAVGDFDRDGVPDLVTAGKYFFRQWRTEDSCGPALRILLHGKGLNPQAIGAKVQVELAGRTVTQWALPSTTGSSSAPELYFGLGGIENITGGTVTWPDGSISEFGTAKAGDTLDLIWE